MRYANHRLLYKLQRKGFFVSGNP